MGIVKVFARSQVVVIGPLSGLTHPALPLYTEDDALRALALPLYCSPNSRRRRDLTFEGRFLLPCARWSDFGLGEPADMVPGQPAWRSYHLRPW